ncbi:MAG: TlpA disulfide reductase family protein [Pirellulales bacterium]
MISIRVAASLFLLMITIVGTVRADEPITAVLHLPDGDFFSGELEDSDTADSLRWQSTAATQAFDFPASQISAVHFAPKQEQQPPHGEYCFELSGGDRLFGDLVGLSPEHIEINAPPLGAIVLDRAQLVRILRRNPVREWVYLGPNGLTGWEQPKDSKNWHEEAGHLITDAAGATVRRECQIPEQACVEFEISWKKKPDFVFTIGTNREQDPTTAKRFIEVLAGQIVQKQQGRDESRTTGFRFEVWEESLVIVSEREKIADVAFVSLLESGEGRLHLRAYLDRATGRLSVYSLDGKRLAQIEVPDPEATDGVQLRNKRGDVRLEQLAVSSWDGRLPVEVSLDEPNVQQVDGSVVYGKIGSYDAAAKQFLLVGDAGEQRIDAADAISLLITPNAESPKNASLRAVLQSGASITGSLVAVQGKTLHLRRDGVGQTLLLPVAEIRSLLGSGNDSPSPPEGIRIGRLELNGVRSHGWLVDGALTAEATCIVWQPRQSTTNSALNAGLSGRLVYRDPPPPKPKSRQTSVRQQRPQARPGIWGGVLDAFGVRKNEQPAPPAKQSISKQALLHLRAGDKVPCQITGVDEEGVHIASTVVDSTFVPHERVKAIELVTGSSLPMIDEKKRQRLLTLPRMQRDNPPTHLIIATNGDVLRGRLEEMNDEHIAVEVHLETRDMPREQIASIIWLHRAELEVEADVPVLAESASTLIQALRPDGIRLTFTPQQVIDNALVGVSDILGACRVDLQTVDMLLMGEAIEKATGEQEFHTWKLAHAVEPRYLLDDAAGGTGPAAPTSGLVGQPAPEIRLKLASGESFQLSAEKGHVVVLDFWASWCGPCMQAMPAVDEVVREFEVSGVKLVTVNMQEDLATVEGALERLKLSSAVALDVDGATAETYGVTAIPQTVVIDAEGKVSHLFVGGGSQLADQLREAIQSLTSKPPAGEL